MANTRDSAPPAAVTPQDILIVRPAFDPEPLLLPEGAGGFLAALMAGRTVGEACAAAGTFDLTATLGLLLSGNAIAGLHLGETP